MSSIATADNPNLQGLYDDVTKMLEKSLTKLNKYSLEVRKQMVEELKKSDLEIRKKKKIIKQHRRK